MNIKELIEQLSGLDPELEVFVSRDPEGNGFETLYTIEELYRTPDNDMYSEEDMLESGLTCTKCVVLWS